MTSQNQQKRKAGQGGGNLNFAHLKIVEEDGPHDKKPIHDALDTRPSTRAENQFKSRKLLSADRHRFQATNTIFKRRVRCKEREKSAGRAGYFQSGHLRMIFVDFAVHVTQTF